MSPTLPGEFAQFIFAFVFGWGHAWLMVVDDLLVVALAFIAGKSLWILLGDKP